MKVKDLISRLRELDPESEIRITNDDEFSFPVHVSPAIITDVVGSHYLIPDYREIDKWNEENK